MRSPAQTGASSCGTPPTPHARLPPVRSSEKRVPQFITGLLDSLWKILSISREQMEEIAMRQNLRDNSGNLLGWRQPMGRRINGYTAAGWLVGWYDPVMNATHNANGHRVGTGDQLSSLIVRR